MDNLKKYFGQQCQDYSLNMKFRNFHKFLVNQIITFCKDNNIIIDEFHLNADDLEDSIKAGSWQSCTDSCLTFEKFSEDYKKAFKYCDKEFLKNKDKKDLDNISLSQKPFLFSM